MKKGAKHDPREAVGYFVMLMFGAFMTLGIIVIVVPKSIELLLGKDVTGWWRSVLIWLVAPGVGIAVTSLVTYRRLRLPHRPEGRG